MRLVDSISCSVNHGMTGIDHAVKKIAASPSTAKDVLQLAVKAFAAFDLYHIGEIRDREMTHVMQGTTDFIEFYGSYKNLMYWVNLFSKESIDQKVLQESINSSLSALRPIKRKNSTQKKLAKQIFIEVIAKEAYHSKNEVIEAVKASLIKHGYTSSEAEQVVEHVIIQQKSDSLVKVFYMACFTLADLGSNILTLKNWNILDFSHLATVIGSQSRVSMFVIDLGMDTVLGVIASAGLVLAIGEASYRAIVNTQKIYATTISSKTTNKAHEELQDALIDLTSGVVDLAATAAPLFFTLNPPTLIALALVSKGTGVMFFLIR